MVISPVAPEIGTVVIFVGEITFQLVYIPPNFTSVTSLKFAPVIVMVVCALPVIGSTEVITGAGYQVNVPNDMLPAGVVKVIAPVAPAPTFTVTLFSCLLIMVAATPPTFTSVVLAR
jgi:hypothetical protein